MGNGSDAHRLGHRWCSLASILCGIGFYRNDFSTYETNGDKTLNLEVNNRFLAQVVHLLNCPNWMKELKAKRIKNSDIFFSRYILPHENPNSLLFFESQLAIINSTRIRI